MRQDFSGSFSGSALRIFLDASSLELMRAILGRQIALSEILDLEDEALAETGNIILNSWVGTIANLLKEKLKISLPAAIRSDQRRIFKIARRQESFIVILYIKFDISDQQIQGYIALMMDVPSIAALRPLIAKFVESLDRTRF